MSEMTKVELPLEAICAYCESQPIERLMLLGANFHDWLRPNTEVGLLVEYDPDTPITYIDMARQERELGVIFSTTIDLRTPKEIEPRREQQILQGATLVFAKNSGE